MEWYKIPMYLRVSTPDLSKEELLAKISNEGLPGSDFLELYNQYTSFAGLYQVNDGNLKKPIERLNEYIQTKKRSNKPLKVGNRSVEHLSLAMPSRFSQTQSLLDKRMAIGHFSSSNTPVLILQEKGKYHTFHGLRIIKGRSDVPKAEWVFSDFLTQHLTQYIQE